LSEISGYPLYLFGGPLLGFLQQPLSFLSSVVLSEVFQQSGIEQGWEHNDSCEVVPALIETSLSFESFAFDSN